MRKEKKQEILDFINENANPTAMLGRRESAETMKIFIENLL